MINAVYAPFLMVHYLLAIIAAHLINNAILLETLKL